MISLQCDFILWSVCDTISYCDWPLIRFRIVISLRYDFVSAWSSSMDNDAHWLGVSPPKWLIILTNFSFFIPTKKHYCFSLLSIVWLQEIANTRQVWAKVPIAEKPVRTGRMVELLWKGMRPLRLFKPVKIVSANNHYSHQYRFSWIINN